MRSSIFTRLLITAALVLLAQSSHAESPLPSYAIGIGLDVSRGAFGGDSTSTYMTAPVIIDWFPATRLDFELTVPLIYQQSIIADSSVAASAKSTLRGPMGGAGSGISTVTTVDATSRTGVSGGGGVLGNDYGMGDVTLTAGYILFEESETSPLVRPSLYVKFPTADESKGFGTGKLDVGAGLAVSKLLGAWQPFAEGRYIAQGAAGDGSGALNFVTTDAGLLYSWSDKVATSAYARFGSALFEASSAPLEARLKLIWRFSERTYVDAYVLKGFSDGSPEYGGGVAVFAEF